jgi:hypothetical protein
VDTAWGKGDGYFVDHAIAATPDFFGDFVVVGRQVAEVSFDFVVLIGLAHFGFLAGVSYRFFLLFLISHILYVC